MKSARIALAATLLLGLTGALGTDANATIWVLSGQSIQDAIDAASPGETIKVRPGEYMETHGGTAALRITKSIKLIGIAKGDQKVRLMPGPGNVDGIVVEPEIPGVDPDVERVTIQGMTVEGFSNHGIWLRYVNKFKLIKNESINNLHNGIFPTLSANGLVKRNVSYGSLDAALWVEAAENVRVIRNEMHSSPTGLEITVSKKVRAQRNDIHDNTVGVGLYHPNGASLPPLGNDGDWDIISNDIYDNNMPNPVTGGLVGQLPEGLGVLVLGVDRVHLKKNEIVNNGFAGIAIVDYCIAVSTCGSNPPIVEPSPDENTFEKNNLVGNGLNPPPAHPFTPFAADIIYTGGTGNCFSGNTFSTANAFAPMDPC